MKRKIRVVILISCVLCFLVVAPVLVAYSMGYRFDFENLKITATGGIYVKTVPAAERIIFDSKIEKKPGLFSNSVFVQSLLPKDHTVLVQKSGYYEYFKTIPVLGYQVTKIEDVLLIKKDLEFNVVESLPAEEDIIPAIKTAVAISTQGNTVIWLGADGYLYKSDASNSSATPVKTVLTPLKIVKSGAYKIIADNSNIFLNNNGKLLYLNTKTNALDDISVSLKDAKISPDGKNLAYYDKNAVYILPVTLLFDQGFILYKTAGSIGDCVWLNNSYVIFTSGDKVIISEIDNRGNINMVTLPQTIAPLIGEEIIVKSPEIFFDQKSNKLYITTVETILESEKLIP